MNESDQVVYMREGEEQFSWGQIGGAIGKSADAARSVYRRAKGTHLPKPPPPKSYAINGYPIIRVIFPTDEHYPYQSEAARSIALQITQDFSPHVLVSGSDGLDFYALSFFDKDPERKNKQQEEINAWTEGQKDWKSAAPHARRVFITGNHEDRLERWTRRHEGVNSLDVLKIQNLLKLKEKGIEFPDANELVLFDRLVIKHGSLVRKDSAYTAKAELEKEAYSISVMSGHTHRGGSFYKRTRRGLVQAHECFCLCDLDPEYANSPNWQNGIALATVSDTHLSVELIPFHDFRGRMVAYWRDKMYEEE